MSIDNIVPAEPVVPDMPAASNWSRVQERRKQPTPIFSDLPINILIVDDEPKNLTVLETVLDDPGYRLVRAESADHALRALVVEEFALLILDIRMPGMTGIELAQMIKERKIMYAAPGPSGDYDCDGRLDLFIASWWSASKVLK